MPGAHLLSNQFRISTIFVFIFHCRLSISRDLHMSLSGYLFNVHISPSITPVISLFPHEEKNRPVIKQRSEVPRSRVSYGGESA